MEVEDQDRTAVEPALRFQYQRYTFCGILLADLVDPTISLCKPATGREERVELTSSREGDGSIKFSGLVILNMTLSTLNCDPLVRTE